MNRRSFLLWTAAAATTAATAAASSTPLAAAAPQRTPITPPGSVGREHFTSRCTACGLCVSRCPSHVLRPAVTEYGLQGVMQPTVSFERGFCNFDCTVCGEVCPTGAILPLTKEAKHLTQMGRVVFTETLCIVHTDHTNCGACSEHCPTQALSMVPYEDGLTLPHVDTDICVGCGGCEYVCPVRPVRAVHVDGNTVQQDAKPFEQEKQQQIEIDDFGF
jgi:ferredoxin-type protein NapF